MKIRAAVLEEFASPLVVQDVDLDGPGPGEVLVRLAACGVCHTDLYTASGADPSGYAPTVLGHEGAGVVEEVGAGVTSLAPGDHVVTLFSPQCRRVRPLPVAEDEPLPRDPRAAEPRLPARRDHAPGPRRRARRHFMGTSTFAEATVMPRDRAGEGRPGRAAGRRLHARLRRDHRHRRRAVHRQGRAGLDRRGVRRRPRRPRRGRRARLAGAERIIARRPVRGPARARPRARRDRHARGRAGHRRGDPRDDRRLRRRLHLRGDRQRRRDAPGRRVGADGLGPLHDRRRGGQGEVLEVVRAS